MRWREVARGRGMDVLIAAGALVGGVLLDLLGAYASGYLGEEHALGWRFIPLALGCLTLLIRRRMPLLAFLLGTVAFAIDVYIGISAIGFLIYQDNLYSGCLYGPRRLHWYVHGAFATLSVATVVTVSVLTDNMRWGLLSGLVLMSVPVTPVFTAVIVRGHRDRAELARAHADQVAQLSEMDRRTAVNAERTRMARELHDAIANHFSAIAVQTAALLSRKDLDAATVQRTLSTIRDNSVRGLAELREMIELLRSDDGGVDEPVHHRLGEVDRLVAAHRELGLDVDLAVDGEPYAPTAAVDLAAYRIVQESLANASKHGGGRAAVRIAYAPEGVVITVDNPVHGRTAVPAGVSGGTGLIGMRERATLLGGTFAAGPGPGCWRVRAELPSKREEHQ